MDTVLQKKRAWHFKASPAPSARQLPFNISGTPLRQFAQNQCRTTPRILPASFCSSLKIKPLRKPAPNAHIKMSIAMCLAHCLGALLASLEPFARHKVNLLKIESRPIHGSPWEYQFFLDVESDRPGRLEQAFNEVHNASAEVRVLGFYPAAKSCEPANRDST